MRKGMIVLINVLLKKDDNIIIDGSFSCTFCGHVIKYNDGVINTFDFDRFILRRCGIDYEFEFDFKSSFVVCKYDSYNLSFDISVSNIKFFENSFSVMYVFNDNSYEYSICWRSV